MSGGRSRGRGKESGAYSAWIVESGVGQSHVPHNTTLRSQPEPKPSRTLN